MESQPFNGRAPAPEMAPDLPPPMAEVRGQSVDDLVKDLKKSPFFMTSLDDAPADEENPDLDAIKALMEEGTRLENAENFREQGNEDARARKWKDGKELYTKGLLALRAERREGEPTGEDEDRKELVVKEILLVNRALCHLELRTSPRFDFGSNLLLALANTQQRTTGHVHLTVWLLWRFHHATQKRTIEWRRPSLL